MVNQKEELKRGKTLFVMDIEKLTKHSIDYCNSIKGKDHKGCGSDANFCKLCRSYGHTADQFSQNNKKINELVRNKFII